MGTVNMSEIDHLMPIMMKREEDAELTPLLSHGSTHFLYIKHNNLYCILYYSAVHFMFFTEYSMSLNTCINVQDRLEDP